MDEATKKKIVRKYCFVPMCQSTSIKSPNKLFFSVPKKQQLRNKWFKAVKRDEMKTTPISPRSTIYCCEDHFDLEKDLENFMEFKLMGNVRAVLKKDATPRLLECQDLTLSNSDDNVGIQENRRKQVVQEALEDVISKSCKEYKRNLQSDNQEHTSSLSYAEIEKVVVKMEAEELFLQSHDSFEVGTESVKDVKISRKQDQVSCTPLPEIAHEEIHIKTEPEEHFEIENSLEFVAQTFEPKTPLKRKTFATRKKRIREDEFDVFTKHIATQLRKMPLDVALTCQDELQSIIANTRVKIMKNEVTEYIMPAIFQEKVDAIDLLGSYASKKLQKMESKQKKMAVQLLLKIIVKGTKNKLTEYTDLYESNEMTRINSVFLNEPDNNDLLFEQTIEGSICNEIVDPTSSYKKKRKTSLHLYDFKQSLTTNEGCFRQESNPIEMG